MGARNDLNAHAVFGDADCAGSVPDCLAPSAGPVFLEGRLVLSLSFQGGSADVQAKDAGELIEHYRLWDDLAERWRDGDLEVLRFEQIDVVVRSNPESSALWAGAVDTRARVIPEPDLDEAGLAANQECDLCWRRA